MTTSAEIITSCGTAGTAAAASQAKWALETTFMSAAASAAGEGETGDALRLGYDVSITTRDAMQAASALYTKISTWDLVTTPRNAIGWTTYGNTITIPSTLNVDLLGSSSLFYTKTGGGSPSIINFRGNSTTTLHSVLNPSGTAGQGNGRGMTASLMFYASTLSTLTIQVDGTDNYVTKLWEQTGTIAGTSSMVRLDFSIVLTDDTSNNYYTVFIKPTKYGTSFTV